MDKPLIPPHAEHEPTRRRLAEGSLLETWRALAPPGIRIRSDAELETSCARALARLGSAEDLHVFAYGSLMWNPALDVAHACRARVQGWHRRFCMRTLLGRGCAQAPGAMLALDRGGACHGVLLRIAAAKVPAEARLLWRREMIAGSYEARWVQARAEGATVPALAFVADRRHERYVGRLPIDDIAGLVRNGHGTLGTARAYFDETLAALRLLGIRDQGLERLRRSILRADAAHAGDPGAAET
jgi:cation transport protein ChaC